jgi:hypothetical protein
VSALALAIGGGVTSASADTGADGVVFAQASASAHVCYVGDLCNGFTVGFEPYAFGGGLACAYASADANGPDVEVGARAASVNEGGCSVSSAGNFINIVCGTGAIIGSLDGSYGTVTESSGALGTGDGGSHTFTLDIVFVGSIGVVTGHTVNLGTPTAAAVAGVVQLSAVPQVPSLADTTCTNSFNVSGALAGGGLNN